MGWLLPRRHAARDRRRSDGAQRRRRLQTVTLLAAQTDFTEAGEIMLFVDESQVAYLENLMWEQGYLDTYQMAGAVQMRRSNDLIWSRIVREYLLGRRQEMNGLMAWNANLTRMPCRMHSEYLRRLFLRNELAQGRYEVDGRPVAVSDIRAPVFMVGTTGDHVAPWRAPTAAPVGAGGSGYRAAAPRLIDLHQAPRVAGTCTQCRSSRQDSDLAFVAYLHS